MTHGTSDTSIQGGSRRAAGVFGAGRVAGLLVLELVLVMALPAVASASSDGTNPSLDQYLESVPTTSGDRSRPDNSGGSAGGGLPASTQRRIEQQGGPDAAALEAVADSPALGAPAPARTGRGGRHGAAAGTKSGTAAPTGSSPSALDASTAAVTGEGGDTGPWLVAGVLLVTAVAAGAALIRRRAGAD